jgi:hypothetical protein
MSRVFDFRSAGARRFATFARGGAQCAGLAGSSSGFGAAGAFVDLFFQDSKVVSGRGVAPTGSCASALV